MVFWWVFGVFFHLFARWKGQFPVHCCPCCFCLCGGSRHPHPKVYNAHRPISRSPECSNKLLIPHRLPTGNTVVLYAAPIQVKSLSLWHLITSSDPSIVENVNTLTYSLWRPLAVELIRTYTNVFHSFCQSSCLTILHIYHFETSLINILSGVY